jgi:hypothetical protein
MIGIKEIINSAADKIKFIYPEIKIYEIIPRNTKSGEAFRVECRVMSQVNSTNIHYEAEYAVRISYFKSESDLSRVNDIMNNIRFNFIGDLLIVDSDNEKNYKQIENSNTNILDNFTGELNFTIRTCDQFFDPDIDQLGDEFEIAENLSNELEII